MLMPKCANARTAADSRVHLTLTSRRLSTRARDKRICSGKKKKRGNWIRRKSIRRRRRIGKGKKNLRKPAARRMCTKPETYPKQRDFRQIPAETQRLRVSSVLSSLATFRGARLNGPSGFGSAGNASRSLLSLSLSLSLSVSCVTRTSE